VFNIFTRRLHRQRRGTPVPPASERLSQAQPWPLLQKANKHKDTCSFVLQHNNFTSKMAHATNMVHMITCTQDPTNHWWGWINHLISSNSL
jgi:hypothetical protein